MTFDRYAKNKLSVVEENMHLYLIKYNNDERHERYKQKFTFFC